MFRTAGLEYSVVIDPERSRRANHIPFEIKFRLPKLRKERIIFDRDEFGRIVTSKVPTRRLFR